MSPSNTSHPAAECVAVKEVLNRVGDKWSVQVVSLLGEGPRRFNDLRRRIAGISQKMLSQTLKSLERDGLIVRTAFPTVPVTVEYALTPLAAGLIGLMAQITEWAEMHIGQIAAARARYDGPRDSLAA